MDNLLHFASEQIALEGEEGSLIFNKKAVQSIDFFNCWLTET